MRGLRESRLERPRRPVLGAAAAGFPYVGQLLLLGVAHEIALDAGDEARSLEHEGGVELQQRGAGLDLDDGGGARVDAADTDQRNATLRQPVDTREHGGGAMEQRAPREPACLLARSRIADAEAGERCVADSDAVYASRHQYTDDWLQICLGKIGGELHHDRASRLAGRDQL